MNRENYEPWEQFFRELGRAMRQSVIEAYKKAGLSEELAKFHLNQIEVEFKIYPYSFKEYLNKAGEEIKDD